MKTARPLLIAHHGTSIVVLWFAIFGVHHVEASGLRNPAGMSDRLMLRAREIAGRDQPPKANAKLQQEIKAKDATIAQQEEQIQAYKKQISNQNLMIERIKKEMKSTLDTLQVFQDQLNTVKENYQKNLKAEQDRRKQAVAQAQAAQQKNPLIEKYMKDLASVKADNEKLRADLATTNTNLKDALASVGYGESSKGNAIRALVKAAGANSSKEPRPEETPTKAVSHTDV